MATLKCERPGCNKKVEEADKTLANELLKLHDVQAHSIGNKPEKPRRPDLAMTGYEQYKTLAGVTKDSSSHLLECLSSEVYGVLFSTYGRDISFQT